MALGGCCMCGPVCMVYLAPLLTFTWGVLTAAGLGLNHHFMLEAKESTEETVQELEVQEEQDYKAIRIVALVTTIVLAAFTGFAMIMSIVRARIALGNSRAMFPRKLSAFYITVTGFILSVCCLCLVWLVLLLMFGTAWILALAVYDRGLKYFLESNFNEAWESLQDQAQPLQDFTDNWDGVKNSAQSNVVAVVDPGVNAVQTVLDAGSDSCGSFCIDLSNFGNLFKETDPNRCLCDFGRFDQSRMAAKEAWQEELPYMLLGLGLAWIGMTLLCIEIQAHLSYTWSERSAAASAEAESASGGFWTGKKALGENYNGSTYNVTYANSSSVSPANWVADNESQRKRQQGTGRKVTPADADAQVEMMYSQQEQMLREQQELEERQRLQPLPNQVDHTPTYTPAYMPEQPWAVSQPDPDYVQPYQPYQGFTELDHDGRPVQHGQGSYPGAYPTIPT